MLIGEDDVCIVLPRLPLLDEHEGADEPKIRSWAFQTPFALSLVEGWTGFGMLTKLVLVWNPLMLRLFDKLTAQHERFPHTSTDFFRMNTGVP